MGSCPSADAVAFLERFTGQLSFQTFDERREGRDPRLSRVFHGSLETHWHDLFDLNERGAGVFVMVNEGNGRGRKASDVLRIRAVFCDLDGAPIEPVLNVKLRPHLIVESSPGRWHVYWLVADVPPEAFKELQRELAARFHADTKVIDVCRVMRLPGLWHRKGAPYLVRLDRYYQAPPYTLSEIVAAFDLSERDSADCVVTGHPPPVANVASRRVSRRTLPDVIREGERNSTIFDLAASLARKGHGTEAVRQRARRVNVERCEAPLPVTEIDAIVASACSRGSSGFAAIPHALLDAPEWKALPHAAKVIALVAVRRYDGHNNGNIALTWSDVQDQQGFGNKATFYRNRARLISAGFLIQVARGCNTLSGKRPDLFAIGPRWLIKQPSVGNETLQPVRQEQLLSK
jgi:hypothetical protein